MNLGRLIERLEAADQNLICSVGFDNAYSYRGYYAHLAFHPAKNILVSDMLKLALTCVGKEFHGYKGGLYTMNFRTEVYLCEHDAFYQEPISEADVDAMFRISDVPDQKEQIRTILKLIDDTVGKWLSASLDDPKVCKEMKDDVNEFFRVITDIEHELEE